MNLPQRISILEKLGELLISDEKEWGEVRQRASQENGWFIPEFMEHALHHIARQWLQKERLTSWANEANIPDQPAVIKTVGIVMAGNIPLVGFHDWLCVFIAGHRSKIKPSSKDRVLMSYLLKKLSEWEPSLGAEHTLEERLPGCDAYMATGSNNSSRYFDYYFSRFPHIIRRNRTSVAILTGQETKDQLLSLADDVHLYFGLGCRNVTKLYVPNGYDFIPLLEAFKKYSFLADHHKYKNNYDYNLALHILNNKFYMTNGAILLVEEASLFAPVSQLNFEYYNHLEGLQQSLPDHPDLQCLVGAGGIPFGSGQLPRVNDYADGVDTLEFLNKKLLN
jgi:hypothetical protein